MTYDPYAGVIYSDGVKEGLKIVKRGKGVRWILPGKGERKLTLIMYEGSAYEVVYDQAVEETLMFKLFVEGGTKNFEMVEDVFPHMVVYKVK